MTPHARVAVSGYYGFENTGDEAIALAITRELTRLGHTPLLLSRDPEATTRAYHVESAPRMSPPALMRALMRSQVLLSGGGGLLQDKTSARNLSYYLGVIRLARLLGKRAVVFNQSIGPLSDAGRQRVRTALRGVRAVVRDRASQQLLAGLGITAELGGDPALLLTPSPGLARDPDLVVLAPRGDEHEATTRLARLSARLRAEGRRVEALSFMPSVDDEAAHRVADHVMSTTEPQRALDTIASAGFVVGVRLHAVILAAAAGTPFAGISYDPKVQGFCTDAGATAVETDFDPEALALTVLDRQQPDWAAVEAMKRRARDSFEWALK